jgi:hypothetical protein
MRAEEFGLHDDDFFGVGGETGRGRNRFTEQTILYIHKTPPKRGFRRKD